MSKANSADRREKRREEAKARQVAYDALTLDQKIAKSVPGSKEYIKLMVKKSKGNSSEKVSS